MFYVSLSSLCDRGRGRGEVRGRSRKVTVLTVLWSTVRSNPLRQTTVDLVIILRIGLSLGPEKVGFGTRRMEWCRVMFLGGTKVL